MGILNNVKLYTDCFKFMMRFFLFQLLLLSLKIKFT